MVKIIGSTEKVCQSFETRGFYLLCQYLYTCLAMFMIAYLLVDWQDDLDHSEPRQAVLYLTYSQTNQMADNGIKEAVL